MKIVIYMYIIANVLYYKIGFKTSMKHAWDLRLGKSGIDILPYYFGRYIIYGYFRRILVIVSCTRGGKIVIFILGKRSERNSVMILRRQFFLFITVEKTRFLTKREFQIIGKMEGFQLLKESICIKTDFQGIRIMDALK